MTSKLPPQATEIESGLIGTLIQFPEAIDQVVTILNATDFYSDTNAILFKAIYDLWSEAKKIDLMVVSSRLKKEGKIDQVGGVIALTKLIGDVSHSHSAVEHAYIIKEQSVKRQFIKYAAQIGNSAFDVSTDIDSLLTLSNTGLDEITDGIFKAGGSESFKEIIDGVIEDYFERKAKADKGEFTGIRTPLFDMNKITGGWQPGDLIIIAGRPAMGKTAFAVQCGVTAAKLDKCVDIYTLEMTSRQFTQRIMSCTTDINIERFRNGELDEAEVERLNASVNHLLKLKINLDDKSGITAEYIKAKSSASHRRGKLDLIIVDYLQLMAFDTKLNSNEGFGSITRKLKGVAKDLNVPVILLSQLNRALEARGNKRPMMSDLRSSGEIEQDADLVIFPFREHYYSGLESDKGKIEIIIAKHRNGRIGNIEAGHNETITQFYDTAPDNVPF